MAGSNPERPGFNFGQLNAGQPGTGQPGPNGDLDSLGPPLAGKPKQAASPQAGANALARPAQVIAGAAAAGGVPAGQTPGARRPQSIPAAGVAPVMRPAAGLPTGQTQRPTPVPLSAAGARPNSPQPVSSRPIPVKARKAGALPDAVDDDEEEAEDKELAVVAKNMPAWLVSTVFHMVVLIILGLWSVVTFQPQTQVLEARLDYAEQLGQQLDDSTVDVAQAPKDQLEKAEKQILTPQNLPPVENPFAAPAAIPDISLNGNVASSDMPSAQIGLALSGREAGSKNVLLAAYGGNATTEGAVLRGLEWLSKVQKADGLWSLTGSYADGGQEENVPAATAMALLAFQGQGNTHMKGKYKANVAKAWSALIKLQDKDGTFTGRVPNAHQRLYTQAQCSIALCELFGMTNDSRYREPAERAIKYAVRIQDKLGGWRYDPGVDSDTSVTGWYVMALQSARMAKLTVPPETLANITKYLDAAQTDGGRQYAYTIGTFTSPAVTAEGLLCRQYLGWKKNDERLIEGVRALTRNPVSYQSERDVYYWYYATQACHHMEGDIWKAWNDVMRQAVPEAQVKGGGEAGSWSPLNDKWGAYGGRLYVTCLSIYMLEVYYRHLPIYAGYKFMPK